MLQEHADGEPHPVCPDARHPGADHRPGAAPAGEDDRFGSQIPSGVIDRVADRAVRELWGSRVKTFVPILALRQAQEILREQDVVISAPRTQVRHVESAWTAGRSRVEQPLQVHDALSIEDDAHPLDERDVLPM
jgi:hypothetical protein